jgi:hypothetical protein
MHESQRYGKLAKKRIVRPVCHRNAGFGRCRYLVVLTPRLAALIEELARNEASTFRPCSPFEAPRQLAVVSDTASARAAAREGV